MADRLRDYTRLMRLDRPIGIFLLLWPVLWALWISAAGEPSAPVFIVFVAGVVLMRSAGCVINDYADREFDPQVERTRDRPLATGRVHPREALVLFAVLALGAFVLVLFMNRLTILMSLVAVLLAASYPFMKRWTSLPQFYLGAAFCWGVPMAFAAQTGGVPVDGWILFGATLCWAVAYDTAYAMVDREDDIRIGIKSTAILFGQADRLMIALFHALTLLLLAWVGVRTGLGLAYYMGLLLATGLAAWQQWLMRTRSRDGSFRAFLHNNRFGAVVFAGLALDYLLRTPI